MKTKNIFKMLAFAMLMPAILLTTSCNKEVSTENTAEKGYELPVTINVNRQGDDPASKATFNESTHKLEFSAGDKLFVVGMYNGSSYQFAGTLDYVSDGKFSGTIYTQSEYPGTAEEFLTSATVRNATLLPAGYESYGYLSLTGSGYSATLTPDLNNAFATSKAAAVEQLSEEKATTYSSGFALAPKNAVLNFTINGLDASTEVAVEFSYPQYPDNIVISKNVTTDGLGTATFAIGVEGATDLKDCTLTVGGNAITLVSESKTVAAGKIYNITREVVTAATRTVTWNASDIVPEKPWDESFTKDGITFAPGMADFRDKDFGSGGTFTTASGKFTKIEVTAPYVDCSGTGWSGSNSKRTWTGEASSSVSYSEDIFDMGQGQLKIVFTIEE